MGDKDQNVKKEEEESPPKQSLTKANNSQGKIKTKSEQNNAGPSNETTVETTNTALPNAIPYKTNLNDGFFVSQINLKHVFTKEELATALKCSSVTIEVSNMERDNVEDGKFNISLADVRKYVSAMKVSENQVTAVLETKAMTTGDSPVISCESNVHRNNLTTDIVTTDVQNPSKIVTPAVVPITVLPPDVNVNNSKKKDFALISRDSLSSIGSNVCRICMTRGRERLISPCNCKGSLASVHLSCLERWLNQVGRNHCELCGYSYPAIRTPRYTVLQALRLWFGNPRNRNHLQSDCLIFWLLSTVTAGLLAVCFVGTQYFVIEGNKIGKLSGRKQEGVSHRITETAMNFFMIIVICGYSVTVYLLWKDHFVLWNRWRRANVNVRLLLSPDASPVPFVPRDNNYSLLV